MTRSAHSADAAGRVADRTQVFLDGGSLTRSDTKIGAMRVPMLAMIDNPRTRQKYVDRTFSRDENPRIGRRARAQIQRAETWGLANWSEAWLVARAGQPVAMRCWALMSVAGDIARDIQHMDIWTSPTLDAENVRIDLTSILTGLARQMLDTAAVACDLGAPPKADTPEGRHAADVINERLAALEPVIESGLSRVAALLEYRNRLAVADRQARDLDKASKANQLDHRIDTLIAGTGHDDIAAAALDRATDDLADGTTARSLALTELRGDYLDVLHQLEP